MINLKHDLFTLAELRLRKEGKTYNMNDVIDYAIKMRAILDKNERQIKRRLEFNKIMARIKNGRERRRRYYLKFGK